MNSGSSYYEDLIQQYNGISSRISLRVFFISHMLKDDHFLLYATMKSGLDTYVISNDYYSDQWHNLEESGDLFRRWLVNRHVLVDKNFKCLLIPPTFEIRVTKIRPDIWIVPYYAETGNISYNFLLFKYLLCIRGN